MIYQGRESVFHICVTNVALDSVWNNEILIDRRDDEWLLVREIAKQLLQNQLRRSKVAGQRRQTLGSELQKIPLKDEPRILLGGIQKKNIRMQLC